MGAPLKAPSPNYITGFTVEFTDSGARNYLVYTMYFTFRFVEWSAKV